MASATVSKATCFVADCLFCKIIKGSIPSNKLLETDFSYAFLDIGPLSKGHAVPDEYLVDILPVAKKVALAIGASHYNLLQNNGKIAHQVVPHVHFHVIPKPNTEEGLKIGWPSKQPSPEELKEEMNRILSSL